MKISEVIETLEKIKAEYGDIDVLVDVLVDGYSDPASIEVEEIIYCFYKEWYYGKQEKLSISSLNDEESNMMSDRIGKAVCINRELNNI